MTIEQAEVMEQTLISTYTLENLENLRREIGRKNLPLFETEIYFVGLELSVAESEILCLLEE